MSTEIPAPAAADGADGDSLWSGRYRQLTIGLVLTITLVAFEALAVASIMPIVKDELGGLGLYGWVFSGFFLGSLLGIVVAGQLADSRGLLLPYAAGLSLFAVGLLIGGSATSMGVLVAGRILQGFGAGAIPATAYTSIGRGIPPALRPRMFAIMSTAWVVPGLIGPAAAIAIEHATSWRVVFLGLIPLIVVAGAMTIGALRALDAVAQPSGLRSSRRLRLVSVLVVGVGAVFAATSGPAPGVAVALVVAGLPLAVWALRQLLPVGTLRLAQGVPATVALRGILTFAFFCADAYVPLAVVDGRGADAWVAGAALTAASLTWASASWTQARLIDRLGPRRLDRIGFAALVVANVAALAVARGAPVGLIVAAWAVGGFGIGLAYAPQAVTVLASAAPGEEGASSARIQLCDALGIALGTGIGGVIVAYGDGAGWSVSQSATGVFALAVAMAAFGTWAAGRLPERVPAGRP